MAAREQVQRFYLAVFRDASIEQALVGHVFVVGLLGPMALLLGISLLGLAFLMWVSRGTEHVWSTWLWCHSGLNHIYKRQATAFLLLLIGATATYLIYGTVVAFLLLPVFASVLGVAIYWHGTPRKGPQGRLVMPLWQRSSLLLRARLHGSSFPLRRSSVSRSATSSPSWC